MKHIVVLAACVMAAAAVMPDLAQLKRMNARFAPMKLKYDTSRLSAGDRKALDKLMEAARILNFVFMDQLWSGDRALYESLLKDKAPSDRRGALLLAEQRAVVRSRRPYRLPSRRAGAQAARREFLSRGHDARRIRALGQGPVRRAARAGRGIFLRDPPRRGPEANHSPYSKAYAADLAKAAGLLREAAALTGTLR